jgi:hypothetical protein
VPYLFKLAGNPSGSTETTVWTTTETRIFKNGRPYVFETKFHPTPDSSRYFLSTSFLPREQPTTEDYARLEHGLYVEVRAYRNADPVLSSKYIREKDYPPTISALTRNCESLEIIRTCFESTEKET